MNVYVLKVNLKEAEYGGYKFIEPERTVLELASDDKMKFVQKVVDLFRENLLEAWQKISIGQMLMERKLMEKINLKIC